MTGDPWSKAGYCAVYKNCGNPNCDVLSSKIHSLLRHLNTFPDIAIPSNQDLDLAEYIKRVLKYLKLTNQDPQRYGLTLTADELKALDGSKMDDIVWDLMLADVQEFPSKEFFKPTFNYTYNLSDVLKNMKSFTFDKDLLGDAKKELKRQLKKLSSLSRDSFAIGMEGKNPKEVEEAFTEAVLKEGWDPEYLFKLPKADREAVCERYKKVLIK